MITTTLGGAIKSALNELYQLQVNEDTIVLQQTKKEFEGDFTLVVFPYVKQSKKGPEQTAQEIGEKVKSICSAIEKFNVVKGFLNISLSQSFWLEYFNQLLFTEQLGFKKVDEHSPLVLLEYSSPNTNKPLHLGHIRNHLLGYSVAELLKANVLIFLNDSTKCLCETPFFVVILNWFTNSFLPSINIFVCKMYSFSSPSIFELNQ